MDELKNVNLYDLLGILQSATLQEIKSAYRKKALSCHPDKNPDNPKAGELFNQLTKALEILLDESARAAYDKVLNVKKAAQLRNKELDSRRKRFKEELEAREKQAQEDAAVYKGTTKTAEDKLQAEIDRLRKESSKLLEEEIAYVQEQITKERAEKLYEQELGDTTQHRLRVRWCSEKSDNGGYDSENLNKIFSKYGEITALVVSNKKKGSALVEFKSYVSAVKAQQLERGIPPNLLTVEWLTPRSANRNNKTEPQKSDTENVDIEENNTSATQTSIFPSVQQCRPQSANTNKTFPCFSSAPDMSNFPQTKLDTDFESVVLRNLRQAEERKRLIQDIENEDAS